MRDRRLPRVLATADFVKDTTIGIDASMLEK